MNCKLLYVSVFLVLFLAGSATALSNSGGGEWKYSNDISIKENSGTPLTDYQILVYLDSKNFDFNSAKSDGSDIRFTDIQGNELSYWIESWNDDAKITNIIVKIPSIPARGETKIIMHYGNEKASSSSNGRTTFTFFDDFETGDLSHYIIERGTFKTSNGMLEGSGNTRARIVLKDLRMRDFTVEAKMLNLASASDPGILFKINKLDYNEYEKNRLSVILQSGGQLYFGDFDLIRNKIMPLSQGIQHPTKLHDIKVSVYGDDVRVLLDGGQEFLTHYDNIDHFEGYFGLRADISNSVVLFDDLRISKYVFPEPSVTVISNTLAPLGGVLPQGSGETGSGDSLNMFMFPILVLVIIVGGAGILIRNGMKNANKPVKQIQNTVVMPYVYPDRSHFGNFNPANLPPILEQWEHEGYFITSLKDPSLSEQERDHRIRTYEARIAQLKKIQQDIATLKVSSAAYLVQPDIVSVLSQIEENLKNPENFSSVEVNFNLLKQKINEKKKQQVTPSFQQKTILNDYPRQKLHKIVVERGTSIIDNPKMVKGLLLDYCTSTGQSKTTYQKEINALIMALDHGIPRDIVISAKNNTYELQRNAFKKRLTDLALDEEVARWAVESWAEALGIIKKT
jgi:hypothetical protein